MQTLTLEQKAAIEHTKGPRLVIAGPGAGKTRVIIEKCVYLINETGIKPENILVTTFTNKARDELYDRLYEDWRMRRRRSLFRPFIRFVKKY
jgi:DNA helicase II / ATP-dependent DNA helicase PcrA